MTVYLLYLSSLSLPPFLPPNPNPTVSITHDPLKACLSKKKTEEEKNCLAQISELYLFCTNHVCYPFAMSHY